MSDLLQAVSNGEMSVEAALAGLRHLPFTDLGFARVDHHRWLRQRQLEFLYAPGKTADEILAIVESMLDEAGASVVVTRLGGAAADALRGLAAGRDLPIIWRERARILAIPRNVPSTRGSILILTGGTADLPVAEEAEVAATMLGVRTRLVADVGVAGLHRLSDALPMFDGADAIVVVAGMEGALPSVVGGLAGVPVIACPTSVGYGANFEGITPLLAMLASCAPGVAAVNIDDGIGAGTVAALIARGRGR